MQTFRNIVWTWTKHNASAVGTTTEEVLNVLSGYFGSIYASNFNRFTKLYRVIIQAPSDSRKNMQSLDNIFVKTNGGMAPVSQFVKLTKTYGAESLTRFNMFSSINVQECPQTVTVREMSSVP